MSKKHIVRSTNAGVFCGEIVERNADSVVMKDARRLWYWSGAASLSELAVKGVANPNDCKFPCAVARVELLGVCEILDMTDEAWQSVQSVKEWSNHAN